MNFQEMMNRASKFNELKLMTSDKHRVIEEKRKKIQDCQKQIQELKADKKEGYLSIFNPKRFRANSDPAATATKIENLEKMIQFKEEELEGLNKLVPIEAYDDIAGLRVEVEQILQDQQSELDNLVPNILAVQEQYFNLLNEYFTLYESGRNFARNVSEFVNREYDAVARREMYEKEHQISTPAFNPKRFYIDANKKVSIDNRIKESHIEQIVGPMGPTTKILKR